MKAIGDYTSALRRLGRGRRGDRRGAVRLVLERGLAQPRQIWAAGGIGVTPFLSMARSLGDGGGPPVHFYYCVERLEEAHFLDEFRAIAARRDDFEVTVVSRDRDGFLSADRLAAENPELASSDVLICGPPAMIVNLRAQLVAHGLPERQIHAEEFGFAKRGPEAAPPPVELPEPREPLPPRVEAAGRALRARVRRVRLRGRGARRAEPLLGRGEAAPAVTVDTSPAAVAAGKAVYASAACGAVPCPRRGGLRGDRSGRTSTTRSRPRRDVIGVVTNGKGVMPSYRGKLTPRQIEQLAAFVSTSAGPNAAAASS